MSVTIPAALTDAIKSKNVVLFVGAGFSHNSIHPKEKKAPLGNELANLISTKFLGGRYEGYPLTFVSDLAISETGLYSVQAYIAEIFQDFSPNEKQTQYASLPWKAIFTTNYDYLIERSYEKNTKPIQDLSKVFRNTPEQQIFKTANTVPYYKLHGCLSYINDAALPLILSADQYITHKLNRERLFSKLLELAMDYPILFVGYSIQDPNIRSILKEIEGLKDGRPRSYMVRPGLQEEEIRFWESKKITAIDIGHEDLIDRLLQRISEPERVLSVYVPAIEKPIFRKFQISFQDLKPTESLVNFLDIESEFVHASMSSPNTPPQAFYKGFFQNWDPIIKNLDITRNEKDKILAQVILEDKYQSQNVPFFFLLKGYAGSGKSVLLKRMAWEAAVEFDKLCLFIRPNTTIRSEAIVELFNYVKERIYIFIDNALDNEKGIQYLIEKCEKEKVPVTIVSTERTNLWNEAGDFSTYLTDEFTLAYLATNEIDSLIDKLEKHNSLGYLENKSKDQRRQEFAEKAGSVLLVALYEATGGKPFEEIILDEYHEIKTDQAKSLYLTVAILHRLGSEARAGLISRVHGINFSEFKQKLYKPLEYIVFDERNYIINDFVYKTRHQHIAEIIFETVLKTEQDRYDEYVRIMTYLDIDYKSDHAAFLAMTNARKLNEIFRDPIRIRNLYDIAESHRASDPKLLQQKGIFEMNAKGGSLVKARQLLQQAYDMLPKDSVICHSLSEVLIKQAEVSKNKIERNQLLIRSKQICDEMVRRYKDHAYSFHTLLKIAIIKLNDAIDDDDANVIEGRIKEFESTLSAAKQQFPEHEFILSIESKFNEIIDDKPKAVELLAKAYNLNKATPYIALRYAKTLAKKSIPDAINVLRQTLDLNPNEKDVNYMYARLLALTDSPYADILHHYRRSFTVGDTRYKSQFWYARTLYLANELEQARKVFDSLGYVRVSPAQKLKPKGIYTVKNVAVVLYGTLIKKDVQYGFVRRDGIGDDVFVHRNFVTDSWDAYKVGSRLSFNLAFGYRGPVGVAATLIN
jgi:hypothetical protein